MKYSRIIPLAFAGALLLAGCAATRPTPHDVLASYEQLKSGLDEDAVGESLQKLEAFRKECARYEISATVQEDIASLRRQAPGRFHNARELMREGNLQRAERILRDLADHLPQTDEGRMAARFMQFEFYMAKANRQMMDRRLDEAERTIREVLARNLTGEQIEQAERVLDAITHARLAMSMAEAARARNACRILQLLLHQYYAENGKYPASLSLSALDFAEPSARGQVNEALSAIESYEVSGEGFQFVAVARDGKTRLRVTAGEIKEEK